MEQSVQNLISHLNQLSDEQSEEILISAYLPEITSGDQVTQNRILLKNLHSEIEEKLDNIGALAEFKDSLQTLANFSEEKEFKLHHRPGLAIFLSPGDIKFYGMHSPVSEQNVHFGSEFFTLPLYGELPGSDYYCLDFSQDHARLLSFRERSIEEVKVPDLPESIMAVAQFREEAETDSQHAPAETEAESQLREYLNLLGKAVLHYFNSNEDNKPELVLAGSKSNCGYFREENPQLNYSEEEIHADNHTPQDLEQRLGKLAKSLRFEQIGNLFAEAHELIGKGKAATDLAEIKRQAELGRVRYVLIPEPQFGIISTTQPQEQTPDQQDHNKIARAVVDNGGQVIMFSQAESSFPTEGLTAVFRY